MDWKLLGTLDRASLIDGVAGHIHDATQSARADRDHDRGSGVHCDVATDETFRAYGFMS